MIRQMVLPFKLEATDDTMTSQVGLVVFGEFLHSLNLAKEIDRMFGKPGSGAGYRASSYVLSLLLMLQGGGRSREDLRMIARDKGLLALLSLDAVPSTDAFGRWLRRMGASGTGVSALESVLDRVLAVLGKKLRKRRKKAGLPPVREVTLDIDASQIVAEKALAQWTYKGEKRYMPLGGHVPELSGMVVHEEFRDGNASPGAEHVPFLTVCLRRLPAGLRIGRFRADSASYQASVINFCRERGIRFVIGADLDVAVREAIRLRGPVLKSISVFGKGEIGLTAVGPLASSRTAVGQVQNPPIPLIRGCWIFSKMIVRRMGVSITMEKVNRTFPETFSSSLAAIGDSFSDAIRSRILGSLMFAARGIASPNDWPPPRQQAIGRPI